MLVLLWLANTVPLILPTASEEIPESCMEDVSLQAVHNTVKRTSDFMMNIQKANIDTDSKEDRNKPRD